MCCEPGPFSTLHGVVFAIFVSGLAEHRSLRVEGARNGASGCGKGEAKALAAAG